MLLVWLHRPLPRFPVTPALGRRTLEMKRVFSRKQSKSARARGFWKGSMEIGEQLADIGGRPGRMSFDGISPFQAKRTFDFLDQPASGPLGRDAV
jgi:hypothetical protein